MVVLAHAGHWALWILYAVPVVVVLVAVGVAVVRERRAQREGAEVSRSPSP
jgi:cytochrome c-type biogenesis protein CcmH/NrfF